MNTIVRLFSRQKANQVQVKKLMTLSFSLHPLCTLASPPHTTHYRFLNVRRPPNLSNCLSLLRMSSTVSEGSNISCSNDATANSDLDSIFKHKRIIRSNVRKSLKEMDPSQRALEDEQKLEKKTVYVPRVEDKNSHMRMLNISSVDDLIANSMNILEPAPVDSRGNQREDGLAFDKCGRRLGRGGGNYLQLANKQNWKQPRPLIWKLIRMESDMLNNNLCCVVALSYSVQILDDGVIPITPNDVYVDALVSPAGVIPISSAALQRMKQGI